MLPHHYTYATIAMLDSLEYCLGKNAWKLDYYACLKAWTSALANVTKVMVGVAVRHQLSLQDDAEDIAFNG